MLFSIFDAVFQTFTIRYARLFTIVVFISCFGPGEQVREQVLREQVPHEFLTTQQVGSLLPESCCYSQYLTQEPEQVPQEPGTGARNPEQVPEQVPHEF